jgi:hypothetical protein
MAAISWVPAEVEWFRWVVAAQRTEFNLRTAALGFVMYRGDLLEAYLMG